ncbi:MAG: hypothetical protein RL173_736 [Fibrobacterota bacterium]|jgi:oligosaccharide reducing-end xylanase
MKLLTLLAVAGACSVASAANLFTNPDFETGATGWTVFLEPTDAVIAATGSAKAGVGRNASAGMEVKVTTAPTDVANNWHIQLQTPQDWLAEKGKTYKLSFWAKADASKSIHLGIGGGPASGYAYIQGSDFGLSTAWKQYEVEYTSTATGVDSVRFNIYVGGAAGTYTFDDFVLDTVSSGAGTGLVQPTKGAWFTGIHRNLFVEIGKSSTDVDTKINAAFEQLFFGDASTERIYREVGTDEAFIDAVDSKDIRSEGQSYGMTIAVMMNRQDVFDKLWKFAKNKMQQKSGDLKGYFAWQLANTSPYSVKDANPAPDGDEYFATSLFLAWKRWGNKSSGTADIFNYQKQADSLLTYMTKPKTSSMLPLIVADRKQIVFSPAQVSGPYTDPSYHIPGFYRLWAAFAASNNEFYSAMADTSWAFFKRASHATTGLMPEYASFEGAPQTTSFNAKSHLFASDACRVGMNIGFSYAWFMDDAWALTQTKKMLGFFASQSGGYKAEYTLDGTPKSDYNSQSLQGANAAAVLATDRDSDKSFVDALWKLPMTSGEWRYYNGLVQMLSLLHVSGKFKAYGSPGMTGSGIKTQSPKPVGFFLQATGKNLNLSGLTGTVRLLDASGREAKSVQSHSGAATISVPHAGIWLIDAGMNGARTIAIP